ncbi:BnaC05g30010D [Brassica napus]|uniref:(rape) hypothetical protein n=2 Tax=Brassica TaxID=3705 RepID=A0A078HNA6_BRANA|nr:unnamed protein product [Brassica napus]CDY38308.1 BnaC05g30010D [Brassica napus]
MMMSDLLPELIEEIPSRVPASSLKPLRSSCKRWNTLFKDRRFAEKHFAKAQSNSHVIILKEFMFCPMNVHLKVVLPSVEFKELRLENNYGGYSRFVLGYENTKSGHTYKIMRYYWKRTETNGTVVEVYEFGSGSWRVLDDVNLEVPRSCVSIKGNTYWANLSITADFLLCFDFTQERFMLVQLRR